MKKKSLLILLIILITISSACATGRERSVPVSNRAVLTREYDEVWKSLCELITHDLEYPIEKAEKGVIETQWISIINVEGIMRWKLSASVKKKREGTEVEVTKKVQVLEKPAAGNKRSEKEPEPGKSLGGWKTGKSDMADEGEILSNLKKKLGL
jgi:hypothetical protein